MVSAPAEIVPAVRQIADALAGALEDRVADCGLDRRGAVVTHADQHELSRLSTSKFLARSLDLLHVAAARLATCTTFMSADDRQLAVAKAAGLSVVDIKRRGPRIKRADDTRND